MKKVRTLSDKHVKAESQVDVDRPVSSRVAWWVAVGLLVFWVGFVIVANVLPSMVGQTQERYLTFEAKFSSQNRTTVWCDASHFGLDQERGAQSVSLPPGEAFAPVRVPLPHGDVRYLRLDFLQEVGTGVVRDFKITDENGGVLRTLAPGMLMSLNPTAKIAVSGNSMTLRHEGPNDYPVFYVVTEYPISASAPRIGVTAASAWLFTLILIVGFVLSLDLFRRNNALQVPATAGTQTLAEGPLNRMQWALLWFLGLFAVIWGAKLLMIRNFGMSLPYWDSWDGEAWQVYIPFFNHTLSWKDLFERFTDHRHFFDRLKALLLITINPQWDARFETAINGAMHALIGTGIAAIAWKLFGKKNLVYTSVMLLIVFALPYAPQAQLQAFWTPYYFMQGFAVLSLWLILCHRPGSSRWLLGLTCAICSFFTMASGALVAAVVLCVSLALLAKDRQAWKPHAITAIACVAVLALAVPFLPTGHFRGGVPAQSFAGFLQVFLHVAAWPTLLPALSVVVWLPWLVLGWRAWRDPQPLCKADMFVLSLGLWVLVQAASLAACRNDTVASGYMAERHMNIINLGALANALAVLAICERLGSGGKALRVWQGIAVGWWTVFLVSFTVMFANTMMERLWDYRDISRQAAVTSRAFAASDDPQIIFSAVPGDAVPIVNRPLLALSSLRNKWVRQMLPEVTPAFPLLPAAGVEPRGFHRNVLPRPIEAGGRAEVWSSYSAEKETAPAVFQSAYLNRVGGGFVQIDVVGNLDLPGMALELRGQDGEVMKIVPDGRAADWRTVMVRCPKSDFCVVAVDQRPDAWFGFAEMHTVSAWSVAAFRVVKGAPFILGGGLALLTVVLLIGGRCCGNRRNGPESI